VSYEGIVKRRLLKAPKERKIGGKNSEIVFKPWRGDRLREDHKQKIR
jgi:hypothetical protein